ncbi:L,D-transpeptidase [Fictibacillus gelatini]|uniref:L,D-transpeptidase n=1 Tax=Fictibacillus gelatini TaxID=225985 RepID=UPI0004126199|nr:L,D-transpeptidase [Fictibacillus gelatini]
MNLKKALTVTFLATAVLCGGATSNASAKSNKDLIIINKTYNKLAFFHNGKMRLVASVATGRKPSYTPEGKFKIVNKIKNRPYYKGHIKGGDPRNPLGDRWLGLNARGTWGTTYAIHGNNNSKSIGKYVSGGCIRMYNKEVRWLFSQVSVGTPVYITSSYQSFKALAKKYHYKFKGYALHQS